MVEPMHPSAPTQAEALRRRLDEITATLSRLPASDLADALTRLYEIQAQMVRLQGPSAVLPAPIDSRSSSDPCAA